MICLNDVINLREIVGKGYKEFWNCKKKYRVLKGGKGSKKSTTTALNFICRMMQNPGANMLVVRKVAETNRDSTFAQLKWAQEKLKVSKFWENKVSPLEMTYVPTGQKILFRGFDDALKLASTTVASGYLCWVWVEEAYEIGSEEEFAKLELSVARSAVPEPLFNQFTITFNPWSERHWLKKRFFETESKYTECFTTTYLCNEYLSEDYIAEIERTKETNYRRYQVVGLGDWGIAEGLVYENWEIGAPEQDEAWKWRTFFGLDYGYTNDPTAFCVFDVNPIDKILYIKDGFYKTKMLNSEIAEEIVKMGYAKERIRADAAEPKSNEDLRRMGLVRICASVKGKDSVMNGITKIQEYKIFVDRKMDDAVAELSSYCFKKDKDDNGINQPEDKNNHMMDAMRYGFFDVSTFHPEEKKTRRRTDYSNINSRDVDGGWA